MVPFGFCDPRRTRPAPVQEIHEKAAEGIRTLDLLHGKRLQSASASQRKSGEMALRRHLRTEIGGQAIRAFRRPPTGLLARRLRAARCADPPPSVRPRSS
jgi:hypothetical protein